MRFAVVQKQPISCLLKILMYGRVIDMIWFAQKKLPCLMIMVYTTISVLGIFTGTVLEPYHAVKFGMENKTHIKISGSVENFFIQHPAEEPVMFSKLGSVRFAPARMGFQRIVSLLSLPSGGKPNSKSRHITGINTRYNDLKNTILLKLRI
jgi:hypothetical protein